MGKKKVVEETLVNVAEEPIEAPADQTSDEGKQVEIDPAELAKRQAGIEGG